MNRKAMGKVYDASELRELLEHHFSWLYEKILFSPNLPDLYELIRQYNGDVRKIIRHLIYEYCDKSLVRIFESDELKTEYTNDVKRETPLYNVEYKNIDELIEILYDFGVEGYRVSELFLNVLLRLRYFKYEPYDGTHFVALRCTRINSHIVYRPMVNSRCGLKKMLWSHYKANEYYEKFKIISENIKPVNGGRIDYLMFIVFTLPKHRWNNINDEYFRKQVRDTLRAYFGGAEIFGIMNFHIWHSENPLMGRFPHCHVVILNLVRDKSGNYYRVRPYIDIGKLKKEYGKRIQYDDPVVHVQYIKLDKRERCIHHLRYNMRKPLIDLERFFLSLECIKELVNVELIIRKRGRWLLELLEFKNKTIPIGNLVSKFKRYFGDVSRKSKCPICGGDLKFWKILRRDELLGKELIVVRKDGMKKVKFG